MYNELSTTINTPATIKTNGTSLPPVATTATQVIAALAERVHILTGIVQRLESKVDTLSKTPASNKPVHQRTWKRRPTGNIIELADPSQLPEGAEALRSFLEKQLVKCDAPVSQSFRGVLDRICVKHNAPVYRLTGLGIKMNFYTREALTEAYREFQADGKYPRK